MFNMLSLMAASAAPSPRVSLVGTNLSDVSVTPTDAEVGYQINTAGTEQSYEGTGGSYATFNTWLLTGSAGDYDCQLTVDSGTTPSGSAVSPSWINLASSAAWTLTDSGVAGPVIENSCTLRIRDTSTLEVLSTATVTMSVHEEA